MILAGLVLVAIIVVVILAVGGKAKQEPDQGTAKTQTPATMPKSSPREPVGHGKAGKKPDRPAPRLSSEQLAKARGWLAQGKKIFNDAQTSRKSGAAVDQEKLQQCKAALEKGRGIFDDVLAWDEEATLEGWASPAYVQEYLALWQKLTLIFNKAQKISRAK